MVKTTYALTLFAAVSLAAPVPNPEISDSLLSHSGSGNQDDSSNQHKNLIEDIPIIGAMLGNV
jgi:hypothetical protein